MIRINYAMCIHGWESKWSLISQLFANITAFSRLGILQAVTYTVKVVVQNKWREIDTLLLHSTNRKYHIAYLFVPVPMNLDDLEGHSPNARATNICATFSTVLTDTRVARSLCDSRASCSWTRCGFTIDVDTAIDVDIAGDDTFQTAVVFISKHCIQSAINKVARHLAAITVCLLRCKYCNTLLRLISIFIRCYSRETRFECV